MPNTSYSFTLTAPPGLVLQCYGTSQTKDMHCSNNSVVPMKVTGLIDSAGTLNLHGNTPSVISSTGGLYIYILSNNAMTFFYSLGMKRPRENADDNNKNIELFPLNKMKLYRHGHCCNIENV